MQIFIQMTNKIDLSFYFLLAITSEHLSLFAVNVIEKRKITEFLLSVPVTEERLYIF